VHIESLACDVQTQDSGGTVKSHSRFNRNASTGDLLNEYDYYTSGSYLTSTYTYNSNGTIATATRPDGFQTTFGNSQCNGYLPDHATNAIGTASMTWDCNLATVATTTDLNSLVTTTTRADSLNRVTERSDNGGQQPVTYTYTSPTQMSSDMDLDSSRLVDTTTTLNSLGQVVSVQHQQYIGSTNYDTVSSGYDSTGHRTSVSQACSAAKGGTCSSTATTTTFDGMNRPKVVTVNSATNGTLTYTYPDGDVNVVLGPAPSGEHTKIVQMEYNGLGWLMSSCAVWTTGGNGSGSCGQRNSASGYLTAYTRDGLGIATQISRNAQTGGTAVNTCSTHDMLGRATQSAVPESGGTCTSGAPSGTTTTLTYDANNSPCTGGLAGHINKSTDPAGNVACFWYDTDGRLNKETFPSGPNSSNSPTRIFAYDSNPQGGTNLTGQLSRASTCTGSCTSYITDEQFGNDIYGRQSDHWQNSPSLGSTYLHTTASYYGNGLPYSLSGIPGSGAFIFGDDGEGRWYNLVVNSNNYVASVFYDPAGRTTETDYSNGDKDTFTYDGASGNMTQAQYTIGTSNLTDTLNWTWQGNGTLKTFSVVDNVNNADNQTCNTISHDDLARITAFNCGSTWNESYSYSNDYAGNVAKSGNLIFNPGYVASNNHFASGSGCTYDTNGNILNDCTLSQSYTWDSTGSMVSYAGNSITNDAFGRMVEKTVSGTTTQLLYSPLGLLGSTYGGGGQLSLKLPLPGGSTITWDNNSHWTINHIDWMGNTRLGTDMNSREFVANYCYGPMGEIFCGTAANSQFEGNSQYTSSGLFDLGTTRYSGTWGRSVSPTGGANGYVKNNSPF
jgi:hypothetical protein